MRIRVHQAGFRHKGISGVPGSNRWRRHSACEASFSDRQACISSQSKAPRAEIDLGTFRRIHLGHLIRSISARRIGPPNKAPEPTSTSVMPRATLPSSDLKERTDDLNKARVMPAVAVAHL